MEITAFHEAGHAMMAYLLGIRVSEVSIDTSHNSVIGWCKLHPSVSHDARMSIEHRVYRLVLVALSGIAAESLTFGTCDDQGALEDFEHAERFAGFIYRDKHVIDSYIQQCQTRARHYLRDSWDPFLQIANHLLVYGVLTERKLLMILSEWKIYPLREGWTYAWEENKLLS